MHQEQNLVVLQEDFSSPYLILPLAMLHHSFPPLSPDILTFHTLLETTAVPTVDQPHLSAASSSKHITHSRLTIHLPNLISLHQKVAKWVVGDFLCVRENRSAITDDQ